MKNKNKIIEKIVNALNANDCVTARKLIEYDLKKMGCKEEYYFYLALVVDDLQEKKDLYSKAIIEKKDFLDAYINRGLVNNELNLYDESIQDYNSAIELDSKCALAYNNRGYTKYKQKDYKGALEDYNKAILLNPKLQMALDNKAKLFTEVCLEDDKDFCEKFYLSLGISEVNSGNYTEAIKSLEESIKINSTSDVAFFYRAVAYHCLGQNERAIEDYSKAIECNKNMVDAYYNRGQLLYKDKPKEALDDFVSAVALSPNFVDAYYSIAAIQKNMGMYEDAIKNLDRIIDIEPQAVNAKALKKLILTKYLKK